MWRGTTAESCSTYVTVALAFTSLAVEHVNATRGTRGRFDALEDVGGVEQARVKLGGRQVALRQTARDSERDRQFHMMRHRDQGCAHLPHVTWQTTKISAEALREE